MKRKIIFSVVVIIGLMSAFVLFSAVKMEATASESEPCEETMQDCSKKNSDTDAGNTLDFESLPGKFFSSVLIN
jgi:hypothetical protein